MLSERKSFACFEKSWKGPQDEEHFTSFVSACSYIYNANNRRLANKWGWSFQTFLTEHWHLHLPQTVAPTGRDPWPRSEWNWSQMYTVLVNNLFRGQQSPTLLPICTTQTKTKALVPSYDSKGVQNIFSLASLLSNFFYISFGPLQIFHMQPQLQ